MTVQLTVAQTAQQTTRDTAGRYAPLPRTEADLAADDLANSDGGAVETTQPADTIMSMFVDAGMPNANLAPCYPYAVDFVDDDVTYTVFLDEATLHVNTKDLPLGKTLFGGSYSSRDLVRMLGELRTSHANVTAFAEHAGEHYDPETLTVHHDGVTISDFALEDDRTGETSMIVERNDAGVRSRYLARLGHRGDTIVYDVTDPVTDPDHSVGRAATAQLSAHVKSRTGLDMETVLAGAAARAEALLYALDDEN